MRRAVARSPFLRGHGTGILKAAFSPEEYPILMASVDKPMRNWDVASRIEIARLNGHEGSVNNAAFSLDGSRIVKVSGLGTVYLWPHFTTTPESIEYARCIVPRELTKEERERCFLDPEPSSTTCPNSDLDCDELRR